MKALPSFVCKYIPSRAFSLPHWYLQSYLMLGMCMRSCDDRCKNMCYKAEHLYLAESLYKPGGCIWSAPADTCMKCRYEAGCMDIWLVISSVLASLRHWPCPHHNKEELRTQGGADRPLPALHLWKASEPRECEQMQLRGEGEVLGMGGGGSGCGRKGRSERKRLCLIVVDCMM